MYKYKQKNNNLKEEKTQKHTILLSFALGQSLTTILSIFSLFSMIHLNITDLWRWGNNKSIFKTPVKNIKNNEACHDLVNLVTIIIRTYGKPIKSFIHHTSKFSNFRLATVYRNQISMFDRHFSKNDKSDLFQGLSNNLLEQLHI